MKKKFTAVFLTATILFTSGITVFADRVDAVIDKPYLALGADLSAQEQMTVLSLLGLDDINVDDYDIISITNADEHEYLDSIWMHRSSAPGHFLLFWSLGKKPETVSG